ncbi:hypothetical protein AHMF7605_23620 [Adhaeribacter arboris]|uniref:Nucleotide modification associated domain-containing protein n=1 Tax=Adhaeribacter arboris TaxID=2072846 RepID=A0A2T2YL86_9BACT|nr:hypothetical protein [Adhaeribacter arboris]PSR56274.1 hypothetical protein AHMF7605_23620 [Adhaeribacter arboris]
MDFYSYKIVRDYGFAPNPFFGICTLANCKPKIRKAANINDWIIGTGAKEIGLINHLIFLMKVTGKITYEEYWSSPGYSCKKPVLNGSLAQIYGDNIYYKNESNIWCHTDSHHSFENGLINEANLTRALSGKYVLISDTFYYFGNKHFKIPSEFISLCCKSRDFEKKLDYKLGERFINWVSQRYESGIIGDPLNWTIYNQLGLW